MKKRKRKTGNKVPKGLEALLVVLTDAEERGLGKGKGGVGEVDCPVCEDGKISYSIASVNGHACGICNTEDCVRFIQ